MAQSAVYTGDSNAEIWHKVQFIQAIRTGKYGTKCSLYRRFERGNMAQRTVYTDDSNGDLRHKPQFTQIILMRTKPYLSLRGRLNKIPMKFVVLLKWQHFSEYLTVLFVGLIKTSVQMVKNVRD